MTATSTPRLTLPLAPGIPRPAAMQIAATEYERYVDQLRGLGPADWSRPTVCAAWDVRAMVAHSLGMAEMSASVWETVRQSRAASRRHKAAGSQAELIDSLTAVQVDKHAGLGPDDLVSRFAAVAPKAVRGRTRTPGFLRNRLMPGEQAIGGSRERWRLGFLVDVCYTRDLWMHRMDIAAATDRSPTLTADHDGLLVADVAREWAARHGQPCSLTLTGPAGGRWSWGEGGPEIELEAVDFCRMLSGRAAGDGLLATPVPF